jgi:hypothetical protein
VKTNVCTICSGRLFNVEDNDSAAVAKTVGHYTFEHNSAIYGAANLAKLVGIPEYRLCSIMKNAVAKTRKIYPGHALRVDSDACYSLSNAKPTRKQNSKIIARLRNSDTTRLRVANELDVQGATVADKRVATLARLQVEDMRQALETRCEIDRLEAQLKEMNSRVATG